MRLVTHADDPGRAAAYWSEQMRSPSKRALGFYDTFDEDVATEAAEDLQLSYLDAEDYE